MTDRRTSLFDRLAELGIKTATVPYPAHQTVEEGKALRGDLPGQFTKNLLLRDKKGTLFLVVAAEDRPIDLKTLHKRVGAQGRLGFASAEQMIETLGCQPGALTPLAMINAKDTTLRVVLDAGMMGAGQLNFHPLINTESTSISPPDLMRFIEACGVTPLLIDLDGEVDNDQDATMRPAE